MTKTLLIGATGLVGGEVLDRFADPLTVLVRRDRAAAAGGWPFSVTPVVASSDQWPAIVTAQAPEILICCLGTTIKAAGSQAAFRAVDHDLVMTVGSAAKSAGARHMILVSSVGASATSSNFYLKTKGEVEDGLKALGFARLDILRPGLLRGARGGPARPGEALAMLAAPLTDALLHGSLRRYRSIPAATVARAIVVLAKGGGSGTHIHEHDAIMAAMAG